MTAGVVVLALLGVGGFLLLDRGADVEPLTAEVDEPVEVFAQQVVVGNCLGDSRTGRSVDAVTVVPCDEQHPSQAVAGVTFDDADDYPGTRPLRDELAEVCTLDAVSTETFDVDDLVFSLWFPSSDSWADGDRTGLCIVTTPTGTTIGESIMA